jgi:hypothetical protein
MSIVTMHAAAAAAASEMRRRERGGKDEDSEERRGGVCGGRGATGVYCGGSGLKASQKAFSRLPPPDTRAHTHIHTRALLIFVCLLLRVRGVPQPRTCLQCSRGLYLFLYTEAFGGGGGVTGLWASLREKKGCVGIVKGQGDHPESVLFV